MNQSEIKLAILNNVSQILVGFNDPTAISKMVDELYKTITKKEIEEPKPWESLSGHIDLMFYKLKKDLMKKKKPRKKKVKRRETK